MESCYKLNFSLKNFNFSNQTLRSQLENCTTHQSTIRSSDHLWVRFQQGDATALGELSKRYYPALLNYGLKLNPDRELAKDILQELFLELWTRRGSITLPDNIKAYLFGAYRNKIYKARLQAQHLAESVDLPFEGEFADEDNSIESHLIQEETQRLNQSRLSQLIAELPKRQREILFLHYYEGLECEQVTQIMGISRQGVYNLLSRTLKDLRKLWSFDYAAILYLVAHFFIS